MGGGEGVPGRGGGGGEAIVFREEERTTARARTRVGRSGPDLKPGMVHVYIINST